MKIDRAHILADALDGVQLTAEEERIVAWMGRTCDGFTVHAFAAIVTKAREQGPKPLAVRVGMALAALIHPEVF